MGRLMPKLQRTDEPIPRIRKGALYEPGVDLNERGGYAVTLERSIYTSALRHKWLTAATAAGTATTIYYLTRRLANGAHTKMLRARSGWPRRGISR